MSQLCLGSSLAVGLSPEEEEEEDRMREEDRKKR